MSDRMRDAINAWHASVASYVVVVSWGPNDHDVIGTFTTVEEAEHFRQKALVYCADASISELQGWLGWESARDCGCEGNACWHQYHA